MRQGAPQVGKHKFNIRLVVVIHRRVVTEPQNVGTGAGCGGVGGERQPFCGEAGGDEFVEARLEERRLAGFELRDICGVKVQANHPKMPGAASRRDASQMPQAENGDLQGIAHPTQGVIGPCAA